MHIPIEVEQAVLAAESKRTEKEVIVSTVSTIVEVLKDTPATEKEIVETVMEKTDDVVNAYVASLMLEFPENKPIENKRTEKHKAPKKKVDINNLNLVELLDSTLASIAALPEDSLEKRIRYKHLANPFMLRPGAFVAKIIDLANQTFQKINTIVQLRELFSHIDQNTIAVEPYYYGTDSKYMSLVRFSVPKDYVCSLSMIKLKDMPRQYYHEEKIFVRFKTTSHPHAPERLEAEICCPSAKPVLSIEPGMEEYHIMSIKIHKETKELRNWMPGMHPQHYNYKRRAEHMCALGSWT
jgi:hypothetical protein